MPFITGGPAGLDMYKLDLAPLLDGTIQTADSTTYKVELADGQVVTFTGSGFTYDAHSIPTGGTLTGITDDTPLGNLYTATGLNSSIAGFVNLAVTGQTWSALQTVLSGADTLVASDIGNRLYGFDGNDSMVGGAGADYLDAGAGDNTVLGGANSDFLTSATSSGHNTLFGGDGDDQIVTGTGFTAANGNKGDDTVTGHSLTGDWLLGGQGNDLIDATASTGHNICNGNIGADTVLGGSGGDSLRGGQGDDSLVGGVGGDWITGDLGSNTLTGGQGADTFHAGSGTDTITDFTYSQGDRVQVDHGVTHTTPSQVGSDVHLDLSTGGHVILKNVQLSSLPADWIFTT